MVRQSKHPERRSSFPKACSDFERQQGAADAYPMGDIFSLFDQPGPYPHPYLCIHLGIQEGPSIQRSHLEHSPSILFSHLFPSSLQASFLLPFPAPHTLVYFVQDKLLFRSSAIKGISSHHLICTVAAATVTCS